MLHENKETEKHDLHIQDAETEMIESCDARRIKIGHIHGAVCVWT